MIRKHDGSPVNVLKIIIALASLLSVSCHATPVLGIGTHFGQARSNEQLFLEWITNSPFQTFRDEIYWGDIETAPGTFKPSKRALNTLKLINEAQKSGIEPLIILDYGNRFYDNGSQPFTDAGRTAFGKYSEWIAQATKGRVNKFEVWNEWNIGGGKKPRERNGDPVDYVKLVEQTSKAIKKVNPQAEIIGGAIGDDIPNWPWLRKAISAGLLNQIDALSVHIYNHSLPIYRGGAKEMVYRLEMAQQIIKEAEPNRRIPIYITEIGWPNNEGKWGVDLDDAATQALIFVLEAFQFDYVKGIWFYEFQDRGRDKSEREDNFGFLNADGQEKPVSCVLRSVGKLLKDANLIKSKNQGSSRILLYRLANGDQLLASWSSRTMLGETTNELSIRGSNLEFKRVDTGCFRQINKSQLLQSAKDIHYLQGYSPTLITLPKSAKIDF